MFNDVVIDVSDGKVIYFFPQRKRFLKKKNFFVENSLSFNKSSYLCTRVCLHAHFNDLELITNNYKLMKKIFTLLAFVLCSLSISATGETFKVWLNGSATEFRSDQNTTPYFTVAGSYNTKYSGATYDGVEFTKGLKLDSSGKVTFTTAAKATVTFVQSTSANGDKLVGFDGADIPQSDGTAGTNYIEYVIENVAAGTHTFAKGNSESGLLYVKVVYTEDVAVETQVATPVISPSDPTDFAESIDVTISCSTNGANIVYSTDGNNYSAYTEAITLTETTTIYAKATKSGLEDSEVSSLTYNKVDATLGAAVDSKVWTFDSFTNKDYKVSQTIDGITVLCSTSKYVSVVNGNGSMDDITFGKRIKLNGASSDTERLLVFKVAAGSHKITVYGNTGSNGKSRDIILSTGSWDNSSNITKSVDGLDKLEYELVSETETTCYVGCKDNIQIAGVVVEPLANAAVPVTITSCGYATLTSDQALDFSGVEGLTAFIATGIDGDKVKTQAIESAPANTGLILKGEAGATYDIPVFTGNPDDVSANKMVGNAKASITLDDNEGYILSKNDGKFHPCSAGTLAAGKAYLAIAPQSAKVLDIEFDDPTAISVVTAERQNADVYNLQGVRVSNTSQKGVYIVNGKKIVK